MDNYENMTREQLIAEIERLKKNKEVVEEFNKILAYEILDLKNKLKSIQDI